MELTWYPVWRWKYCSCHESKNEKDCGIHRLRCVLRKGHRYSKWLDQSSHHLKLRKYVLVKVIAIAIPIFMYVKSSGFGQYVLLTLHTALYSTFGHACHTCMFILLTWQERLSHNEMEHFFFCNEMLIINFTMARRET